MANRHCPGLQKLKLGPFSTLKHVIPGINCSNTYIFGRRLNSPFARYTLGKTWVGLPARPLCQARGFPTAVEKGLKIAKKFDVELMSTFKETKGGGGWKTQERGKHAINPLPKKRVLEPHPPIYDAFPPDQTNPTF